MRKIGGMVLCHIFVIRFSRVVLCGSMVILLEIKENYGSSTALKLLIELSLVYCAFQTLGPDDLVQYMADLINDVFQITNLPKTLIRMLMEHYKWDKDILIEQYFEQSYSRLFANAAIMPSLVGDNELPRLTLVSHEDVFPGKCRDWSYYNSYFNVPLLSWLGPFLFNFYPFPENLQKTYLGFTIDYTVAQS